MMPQSEQLTFGLKTVKRARRTPLEKNPVIYQASAIVGDDDIANED